MCVRAYTRVCAHVCITFLGVCCVNMCGYVCTRVCACVHVRAYVCVCMCACACMARARTTSGNPHCTGFRRKDVCSQGTVPFLKASSFKDRFVNISETNPRAEPLLHQHTHHRRVRQAPTARLAVPRGLPGGGEGGRGGGPAFILNSVSPSGTSSQLGWTSGSQYLLSLFLVLKGEETHSKSAISEEPGLKSCIKSPVGILPHRTPWTGCGR